MNPIDFDTLSVGSELPSFTTPPVSRLTLALYCGSSGDHNPLHVDTDFARGFGLPDVIAHGMLSAAYLGRLLTNWVDQEQVRSLSVRFAAMTQVGEAITCTGRVLEKDEAGRSVRLALATHNQAGVTKLSGEAVVAFPA